MDGIVDTEVGMLSPSRLASLVVEDALSFLESIEPGSIDLIVSSPPYFMGKEYDTSAKIDDFVRVHEKLGPPLARALKRGGNLCWQVGHHVRNGRIVPLDIAAYGAFSIQEFSNIT